MDEDEKPKTETEEPSCTKEDILEKFESDLLLYGTMVTMYKMNDSGEVVLERIDPEDLFIRQRGIEYGDAIGVTPPDGPSPSVWRIDWSDPPIMRKSELPKDISGKGYCMDDSLGWSFWGGCIVGAAVMAMIWWSLS